MKRYLLSWASILMFLLSGFTQQAQAQCTKSSECFDFTYKGYVMNGNATVTLSFAVKVNCDKDLSNVAFELPSGAKAIYATGPSGYENGTTNPFWSVKFNTGSGYKDGKTANFSYTISTADFLRMTSLRVQAKASTTVGEVFFDPKGCGSTGGGSQEEDDKDDDKEEIGECVAVDECFEFIYKGFTVLPSGNVKLTYQVTTNCEFDLSYVAFELPAGARAKNPLATKYKYTLENTTNSPFYSVKFEATTADGYKNGNSDTFSYELTALEFARLTAIRVQAKAGVKTGTVTLNPKGCAPSVCEDPEVALVGPETICNLSDEFYTFSVAEVQAGVAYEFTLPEGFIVVDEGEGYVTVAAIFEEDQLNQPQTITVTATNECGTATASMEVVVTDCGVGEALPVTMTRFDGVSRNGAVELSWATATEINNDRFEVERSTNGKDFVKIGEVKGAGNSSILRNYTFTDRQASKGTVYYRLNQVDTDKTNEYSKVIAVQHNVKGAGNGLRVSLYPNPVTNGNLNIRFDEMPQGAGDVAFQLIDMSGRVVHTRTLNGNSAEAAVALQSLGLKQGVYMVSITAAGQKTVQRVVIQ